MNLSQLPEEVLCLICRYVDYADLCSLSKVSTMLKNFIYNADSLWKTQCIKWWLDDRKTKSDLSWRDNFLAWFQDMGQYVSHYRKVRMLWNQIEKALSDRCPAVLSTLGGPAEEREFEKAVRQDLPLDVRCSYRIRNGQRLQNTLYDETKKGLLGHLEVYGHQITEVLLPAGDLRGSPYVEIGEYEQIDPKSISISQRYVYFENDGDECKHGYQLSVCTKDYKDLRRGNVFIQARGRSTSQRGASVLIAGSFTEFLERLANSLEGPHLQLDSGRILQFQYDPACVAVTRNVSITVATALVPELSILINGRARRLMHAYRIRMAMDKDCSPKDTCKLKTRHWEIVEDVSKPERVETVDGEAVIGLYPEVSPGSVFSYVSWTPMQFEEGFMQGHFTFRNLSTDEEYDVVCPRFYLRCSVVNYGI